MDVITIRQLCDSTQRLNHRAKEDLKYKESDKPTDNLQLVLVNLFCLNEKSWMRRRTVCHENKHVMRQTFTEDNQIIVLLRIFHLFEI